MTPIPAIAAMLAVTASLSLGADAPAIAPAPAPTPAVREVVPAAKLVKAVRARDAARSEVRDLRRLLAHSPDVQEALTIASVVYGVSRAELSSVAWCESTHRADARNGQYRGLFQEGPMFESGPFGRAGLSVWSPYASAMTAAYVVKQQGWRQWQCQPGGGLAW